MCKETIDFSEGSGAANSFLCSLAGCMEPFPCSTSRKQHRLVAHSSRPKYQCVKCGLLFVRCIRAHGKVSVLHALCPQNCCLILLISSSISSKYVFFLQEKMFCCFCFRNVHRVEANSPVKNARWPSEARNCCKIINAGILLDQLLWVEGFHLIRHFSLDRFAYFQMFDTAQTFQASVRRYLPQTHSCGRCGQGFSLVAEQLKHKYVRKCTAVWKINGRHIARLKCPNDGCHKMFCHRRNFNKHRK